MRGIGRLTRASFGLQVLVVFVLLVAAAILAIEVADWRYVRIDLSTRGRNTVDPATLDLIEGLEEDVVVETFLRPLRPPYRTVSLQAQGRLGDLLFKLGMALRDRVKVVHHDASDLEAFLRRQRELGIEGENVIVVRLGERQTVIDLFGDVAVVSWGSPSLGDLRYLTERGIPNVYDPRKWRPGAREPAILKEFLGEVAIAEALARLSATGTPHAFFSQGHGEPALEGDLPGALGSLARALERDGFEVLEWDPARSGSVPAACDVLAVVGPSRPFLGREVEAIRAWVEGGGRLIAALPFGFEGGQGSLAELLAGFGMRPLPGLVCEWVVNVAGQPMDGVGECSVLTIGPAGLSDASPITVPLRLHRGAVVFHQAAALELGAAPPGRRVVPLVTSSTEAWLDLPDPKRNGAFDYALDQLGSEPQRAFVLAALATFDPDPAVPGGEASEARVLAISSSGLLQNASFASNRDFLQNAFNWMVERDFRVGVTPRDPEVSRLEVTRGRSMMVLSALLWLGLPGGCMLVGVLVAWRRRR